MGDWGLRFSADEFCKAQRNSSTVSSIPLERRPCVSEAIGQVAKALAECEVHGLQAPVLASPMAESQVKDFSKYLGYGRVSDLC